MKCINCGNDIQEGLAVCPFCNANQTNQVPATPIAPVLPQDQNMVVTPVPSTMPINNEPIAEVVPPNEMVNKGETHEQEMIGKVNNPQPEPVNLGQPVPPVPPIESVAPVTSPTPVPPIEPVPPVPPVQNGTPIKGENVIGYEVKTMPEVAPQTIMDLQANPPIPPVDNINGEKIGSSAPVIEHKKNKKKNMIILILGLILLVLLGIGLFIYFYEFKSADKRIDVISKTLLSFTRKVKNDDVELSSGKYAVKGNMSYGDTTYKLDLDGTYGIDLKSQLVDYTLNVNSLNLGEELLPSPLNVELYLNNSKAYLLLQNFYDKYIYTTIPDMEEIFARTSQNDINYVVIINGINTALTRSLKNANIEQKIETVVINGKKEKVNVMRLSATSANKKILCTTFFRTLANNENFLTEYAKLTGETPEKVKQTFEDTTKDLNFENDPNTKIEIYSPVFGKAFKGIKLMTQDSETKKNIIAEIFPITNGYGVNVSNDSKSVFKGELVNTTKKTSTTEEETVLVNFTVFTNDTTYKAELNINIIEDVNPKVEKVNVKNSIDYQYLSLEEKQAIINSITSFGNIGMYVKDLIDSSTPNTENKCNNAFNCVDAGDGVNNVCSFCEDGTNTCLNPNRVACPIGG